MGVRLYDPVHERICLLFNDEYETLATLLISRVKEPRSRIVFPFFIQEIEPGVGHHCVVELLQECEMGDGRVQFLIDP